MPSTALAAAPGMPKHRRQAKPMLRFALPIEPGLSPRAILAAQIELLVDLLDQITPDTDLEDNGDLEPSIGTCVRGVVDAEWDGCDDKPSLGSPEGALGEQWGGGNVSDFEEEVRTPTKSRQPHNSVGVPYRGIRRWHEEQAAQAVDQRLAEIVGRVKRHASRDELVMRDAGAAIDDVLNVLLVKFEEVRP